MGTRDDNNELWNFDDEDKREVIREYVKTHKPLMIIGSHVQAVAEKMGAERVKRFTESEAEELRSRNKEHQQFLAEMYDEQAKGRRYFTHETIESDVVCGRIEESIQKAISNSGAERVKLVMWVNESGNR